MVLSACASGPPPGETLTLSVSDPYDFAEMRSAPAGSSTITGVLALPADGRLRGAAILSHGAGGVGSRQYRMAERLIETGIAALILDHFEGRDVGSVAADQLRVPEQTMLSDIRIARDALMAKLALPADRIGAIGWSKGATTVTLGAVGRLWNFADPGEVPLAFAVGFYPFCGFDLGEDALSSPLLKLLGGQDDWTPPGPCIAAGEDWLARGQPVDWRVYENAPHGFDSGRSSTISIGRAITVRDTSPACTLTVDETGRTVTLDRGFAFDGVAGRRAFLERCGVRGVSFGGDDAAREEAFSVLDAYLAEWLP
ncbi:MAG: dienelactone hydrolase family protein [Pseudomonadota bacterium]